MTTATTATQTLPRAAPARVLALGAYLKNTACLLDGATVRWSTLHGDLSTPEACVALEASAHELLRIAGGHIDAVAHDLHPDFESTRLAISIARRLGVPAIGVQHHHAHVGVVQAEHGDHGRVIGLALDGVGLGTDRTAWGGELLGVQGPAWQRIGHLTPLALPGGDIAAREPWRMGAAALHALGRDREIVPRFAPVVGDALARGVRDMLARGLNCPPTTSAGRWFDALAGLLGFSVRQATEAEAAIALERAAARWLDANPAASVEAAGLSHDRGPGDMSGLDLRALVASCIDSGGDVGATAARFHLGLAAGLAHAAIDAARDSGTTAIVLAGGCFFNRVLTRHVVARIEAAGLEVRQPGGATGPGDAGLALGQAWIAAHTLAADRVATIAKEEPACA